MTYAKKDRTCNWCHGPKDGDGLFCSIGCEQARDATYSVFIAARERGKQPRRCAYLGCRTPIFGKSTKKYCKPAHRQAALRLRKRTKRVTVK